MDNGKSTVSDDNSLHTTRNGVNAFGAYKRRKVSRVRGIAKFRSIKERTSKSTTICGRNSYRKATLNCATACIYSKSILNLSRRAARAISCSADRPTVGWSGKTNTAKRWTKYSESNRLFCFAVKNTPKNTTFIVYKSSQNTCVLNFIVLYLMR